MRAAADFWEDCLFGVWGAWFWGLWVGFVFWVMEFFYLRFRHPRTRLFMFTNQKRRNPRITIPTPLITRRSTKRILKMPRRRRKLIPLRHRIFIATMFQMVGQLPPKERPHTEGTALVLHVLEEKLILLVFV